MDHYLVSLKKKREKNPKSISNLAHRKRKGRLLTAVRNIFHTRSAAILAQEHENLITRKQGR